LLSKAKTEKIYNKINVVNHIVTTKIDMIFELTNKERKQTQSNSLKTFYFSGLFENTPLDVEQI